MIPIPSFASSRMMSWISALEPHRRHTCPFKISTAGCPVMPGASANTLLGCRRNNDLDRPLQYPVGLDLQALSQSARSATKSDPCFREPGSARMFIQTPIANIAHKWIGSGKVLRSNGLQAITRFARGKLRQDRQSALRSVKTVMDLVGPRFKSNSAFGQRCSGGRRLPKSPGDPEHSPT